MRRRNQTVIPSGVKRSVGINRFSAGQDCGAHAHRRASAGGGFGPRGATAPQPNQLRGIGRESLCHSEEPRSGDVGISSTQNRMSFRASGSERGNRPQKAHSCRCSRRAFGPPQNDRGRQAKRRVRFRAVLLGMTARLQMINSSFFILNSSLSIDLPDPLVGLPRFLSIQGMAENRFSLRIGSAPFPHRRINLFVRRFCIPFVVGWLRSAGRGTERKQSINLQNRTVKKQTVKRRYPPIRLPRTEADFAIRDGARDRCISVGDFRCKKLTGKRAFPFGDSKYRH